MTACDHQVPEIVLKHGAGGATVRTPDGTWSTAAQRVTVADTTGAGDAFAVATPGDWQGLPTRADLELLDLQAGSTVR